MSAFRKCVFEVNANAAKPSLKNGRKQHFDLLLQYTGRRSHLLLLGFLGPYLLLLPVSFIVELSTEKFLKVVTVETNIQNTVNKSLQANPTARCLRDASCPSSLHDSSSNVIKGTIGYTPPEYGMGGEVSTYGDVYSYQILLLEMLTGKRPTDDMFKDGMDLHNFVMMALPEHVGEICDPLLVQIEESSISTNPRSNKGNNAPNDQRKKGCGVLDFHCKSRSCLFCSDADRAKRHEQCGS